MGLGSFFKKIAGPVAGGFASLIPGAGAALGPLVGGLVGGALNGRGGGGGGSGDSPAYAVDPERAKFREGVAGGLAGQQTTNQGFSEGFLNDAKTDLGGARGFYGKLASGDPAAVASALAPQLNQARRNSANTIDQIQQFGPRGGGTGAALGRARIARAGTQATILGQAPYLGAQGLAETAQLGGNLGTATGGLAVNAGNAAGDLSLGEENANANAAKVNQGSAYLDLARDQNAQQMYGGLGTAAADILGATGWGQKISGTLGRIFGMGGGMGNKVETPSPSSNPWLSGQGAGSMLPPPQVPPMPEPAPGPVSSQYQSAYKAATK